MKTINSKTLVSLILFALLIGANGCLTQSAIQYGKGHPDRAWIHNEYGLWPVEPDTNSVPHAAYYILTPACVPADVATSPFQLIWYAYFRYFVPYVI